jgi:hypothetical protein
VAKVLSTPLAPLRGRADDAVAGAGPVEVRLRQEDVAEQGGMEGDHGELLSGFVDQDWA